MAVAVVLAMIEPCGLDTEFLVPFGFGMNGGGYFVANLMPTGKVKQAEDNENGKKHEACQE